MTVDLNVSRIPPREIDIDVDTASAESAVSWAAILAGAVAALATTLILLELGLGLGLTTVSAWTNVGARASTVGIAGGLWLIFVQWFASGIGGYMAGRLRTKWVGVHTDEVFFRDTAHGFLAWCAATAIGVLVFAAIASSAVTATSRVAGGAATGIAQPSRDTASPFDNAYYGDMLWRPAPGSTAPQASTPDMSAGGATTTTAAPRVNEPAPRAEAMRVLSRDLRSGDVSAEDRVYLAQTVAARTGLSQPDAEKRVDTVIAQMKAADTQAREAAEKARKAAASAAIIGALAMIIGAFIASVAAALGGKLRDEY